MENSKLELLDRLESDLFNAPTTEVADDLKEHTLFNDSDQDIEDGALRVLNRLARKYTLGGCHKLALALMEELEKPIVIWNVTVNGSDEWQFRHAAVLMSPPDIEDCTLEAVISDDGVMTNDDFSAVQPAYDSWEIADGHGVGKLGTRSELYDYDDSSVQLVVVRDFQRAKEMLNFSLEGHDNPRIREEISASFDCEIRQARRDAEYLPGIAHLIEADFDLWDTLYHTIDREYISEERLRRAVEETCTESLEPS